MAALEHLDRHVEHGHVVGHEESVEAPALERLSETLEDLEVEIRVGDSAGIAPGAGVYRCRPHECAEPQLPLPTQRAASRFRNDAHHPMSRPGTSDAGVTLMDSELVSLSTK
jgi:hypothetical protein